MKTPLLQQTGEQCDKALTIAVLDTVIEKLFSRHCCQWLKNS